MFAPSAGEQRPSPRMIRCRDAWVSEWLPVIVRQEGIRIRSGLRESILGHPGGPWSMRKSLGVEMLPTVVDSERAVKEGVDLDARPSVAALVGSRTELEEASVELDGVIGRDCAAVLEAADAGEVGGCWPPRGLRVGRGVGEAHIVARPEAVKDTLGVGERARLREAEFDDEAILEGAKKPFHASLALR